MTAASSPTSSSRRCRNEPITLYGDGSQTRAFCYVDDLIEGFVRMMDAPDDITGPMNLGNPVETSVAELAELIIDLTGSRSTIVHRPLPVDDPVQRCPDISQAEALLDWQPRTQLRPACSARSPISTRSWRSAGTAARRRGPPPGARLQRRSNDPESWSC